MRLWGGVWSQCGHGVGVVWVLFIRDSGESGTYTCRCGLDSEMWWWVWHICVV